MIYDFAEKERKEGGIFICMHVCCVLTAIFGRGGARQESDDGEGGAGGREGWASINSESYISHVSPVEMSKKSFRNNLSARLWTRLEGYLDNSTEWQ